MNHRWRRGLATGILASAAWLAAAVHAAAPGTPDLRPGATLESVLATLNAHGQRIVYSTALVTPEMTLRAAPRAQRIDELLEEILAPWGLRAVPAERGGWLIVAAARATALPPTPEQRPEQPAELESIDVTASRYSLAVPGSAAVFLDRHDVERTPHLADDAVRMLKVMPGVSGGDFSAALNIRGGRREETLLRIDGAEIHNGFHFRDLDGALSVLDTHLVDSIDFITGGLPAPYGDVLSGVVDLRTRRPSPDDEFRSAAGVSFVSAYGRSGGTFAQGRGAWLASVRRGYLDVVMEQVQAEDEQITPRYTDVFASVFYDVSDRSALAFHLLWGQDDLRLVSFEDEDIDSAGEGGAAHAWLRWTQGAGERLSGDTVLSASTVRQQRAAAGEDIQRAGDVTADFRFRFLDLRSDWSWAFSERQMWLFGVSAGRSQAAYDYSLLARQADVMAPGGWRDIQRAYELRPQGSESGAHVAWRGRPGFDLVVEAGLRWDQYRYPHARFTTVSPRLNALRGIGGRGELRAAWGVAHQGQGIHELAIEDGLTRFFAPERVEQVAVGYTHRLAPGWSARWDLYRKDYSRLRPRFENALDPLQLIPEGALDRVRIDATRALARGMELTVRREAERGFSGWASLVLARARDLEPGTGPVPRSWDQARSLSLGLSWTGAKWDLNLTGLYHSGTPTTDLRPAQITPPGGEPVDVIVAGPRNAARLGDYARIDLRASRSVLLRKGRFHYYLEVTNLLDRENPCCRESYFLQTGQDGRVDLRLREASWLPRLPSFGIQFEF